MRGVGILLVAYLYFEQSWLLHYVLIYVISFFYSTSWKKPFVGYMHPFSIHIILQTLGIEWRSKMVYVHSQHTAKWTEALTKYTVAISTTHWRELLLNILHQYHGMESPTASTAESCCVLCIRQDAPEKYTSHKTILLVKVLPLVIIVEVW